MERVIAVKLFIEHFFVKVTVWMLDPGKCDFRVYPIASFDCSWAPAIFVEDLALYGMSVKR